MIPTCLGCEGQVANLMKHVSSLKDCSNPTMSSCTVWKELSVRQFHAPLFAGEKFGQKRRIKVLGSAPPSFRQPLSLPRVLHFLP